MRNILNIQPLIDAVKDIEKQQVCAAIGEGCSVVLSPENPAAVEYYGNGPASATVHSVRIKDGNPVVTVFDNYNGGTFDLYAEDLYPGQLIGILHFI